VRILVLTNLYPPHHIGGYELICQTVVETLWERGHFVPILTSNHVVDSARLHPDSPGVERLLRIHGLYGHPWRGICPLRHIERHNNQVLRSALQRHHPELVYVWNMGGLSKSMLLTLQNSGIPTVYYLSDHWIARGLASDVWLRWWNRTDAPWLQRLVRRACRWTGARRHWDALAPTRNISQIRFRRIYFCSRALLELTARAGYDVSHGEVIYCPVHLRYFERAPRPLRQPIRRLLYVGRLAEDKGVLTALRALTHLSGKLPVELSLFGRGDADYVGRLKSFAADHHLQVNFQNAELDQMPDVYQDLDLLLFTSEWAEPFALTPLEAMACGLPVIGTTTGGSAELFRPRENALTYAAGNAEELARRILEFNADFSLRSRCRQTALLEARSRYAAPVVVDQIEAYLRETVRTWAAEPIRRAPRPQSTPCVPCVS